MNDLAARQLLALREVGGTLEAAGIDYWVFGGWAVDLHAGRVTRAHDDVDLAVWHHDLSVIGSLLEAQGWRHAPTGDENGGTGYERAGVRLELTFLARDREGIYTPLREGRASWSEETFADDVRELMGTRARVTAREPLAHGKSSPRADPEDASKDRADHLVLSELDPTEELPNAPTERPAPSA